MIKTLPLLFTILTSLSFAQERIELSLDVQHVRVGEEVELKFSMEFFSSYIKKQINSDISDGGSSFDSFHYPNQNEWTELIQFSDTGSYVLGPYTFEFDSIEYITDSLKINVINALPEKEGVWLRTSENSKGQQLLIVEQKIDMNKHKSKSRQNSEYGWRGDDDLYTEIHENDQEQVRFIFAGSSIGPCQSDPFEDSDLRCSYRKYVVAFANEFEGSVELTEDFFVNFPKKVEYQPIAISPSATE